MYCVCGHEADDHEGAETIPSVPCLLCKCGNFHVPTRQDDAVINANRRRPRGEVMAANPL